MVLSIYENRVSKLHEAQLAALRNLNNLTRLVQDIDPFTVSRDLKNIGKALGNCESSIDKLVDLFANETTDTRSTKQS